MKDLEGQMSIFDFIRLEPQNERPRVLSVGDKIGRVILGECKVATITKIEGLPDHPYYRTDAGCCYSVEDGEKTVEELMAIAERKRAKYETVIPENLAERITVEYEPRECDGRVLWAQIGIIGNMLFWKESVTYQFLEPYDSEKEMLKEYNRHKDRIMAGYLKYRVLDYEKPMHRLYRAGNGIYADAEYIDYRW